MMEAKQPWSFLDGYFSNEQQRGIIQVDIGRCNFLLLVVEPTSNPDDLTVANNSLVQSLKASKDTELKVLAENVVLQQVLALCRIKYKDTLPGFANTIFVVTSDGGSDNIHIDEQLDPCLLPVLRTATELFGPTFPHISCISRSQLSSTNASGEFFLPQTRLVQYRGKSYVAKGPTSPERVRHDFDEVKNMISLPRQHPNIISPPIALIKLSDTDDRLCGFLIEYYPNGNLDCFSHRLRTQGTLNSALLLKWFMQLVDAIRFLISAKIWHGDIKPDNILVSATQELVLTDLALGSATIATASPEVLGGYSISKSDDGKLAIEQPSEHEHLNSSCEWLRVPPSWPLDAIERSEVYSIGRTMYLIAKGLPMMEVYRNQRGMLGTAFECSRADSAGIELIILKCVKSDPLKRLSLAELAEELLELYSAKYQEPQNA